MVSGRWLLVGLYLGEGFVRENILLVFFSKTNGGEGGIDRY